MAKRRVGIADPEGGHSSGSPTQRLVVVCGPRGAAASAYKTALCYDTTDEHRDNYRKVNVFQLCLQC